MRDFLTPLLLALAAILLDRLLGEPKRFHPLVGFGRLADLVERTLRRGAPGHPLGNRLRGLIAWSILVAPPVLLAAMWAHPLVDLLLLTFALGARSLAEHAQAVAAPLAAGDLPAARQAVGQIVTRETALLDEAGVAKAAVESVLENGLDAVFGALFWFFLAGGAGALLFRLANTLDAMWGHRDERRRHFGWAAARLDDLLGLVPARLTALTYALLGSTRTALACWLKQARQWPSPNAGPVMAAGLGALKVGAGGTARYAGRDESRPALGCGPAPKSTDIRRAQALITRGVWLWLAVFAIWSFFRA
ncbi:adenosylcobinamide-phosphate synthase CbiB [Sulfuricystis thermophila]|uniref:adenosylcobinamide-phosphate synthase CbiB n=1 Tax=Sulfuricystis thermophila TaxID=2496847 RepID=UPI001035E290|nr:adenosylcobinamide-phosphate synthase CbiB [Sulfuricystis thermophila]